MQFRRLDRTLDGGETLEIFPGIASDPDVRFGRACISGTRIDVATVVSAIAAGDRPEEVAREHRLSNEQILAALSYAAHLASRAPQVIDEGSETASES